MGLERESRIAGGSHIRENDWFRRRVSGSLFRRKYARPDWEARSSRLGDHDLGCFDESEGFIAGFKGKLARGVGGDDRSDALAPNGQDNLGQQPFDDYRGGILRASGLRVPHTVLTADAELDELIKLRGSTYDALLEPGHMRKGALTWMAGVRAPSALALTLAEPATGPYCGMFPACEGLRVFAYSGRVRLS